MTTCASSAHRRHTGALTCAPHTTGANTQPPSSNSCARQRRWATAPLASRSQSTPTGPRTTAAKSAWTGITTTDLGAAANSSRSAQLASLRSLPGLRFCLAWRDGLGCAARLVKVGGEQAAAPLARVLTNAPRLGPANPRCLCAGQKPAKRVRDYSNMKQISTSCKAYAGCAAGTGSSFSPHLRTADGQCEACAAGSVESHRLHPRSAPAARSPQALAGARRARAATRLPQPALCHAPSQPHRSSRALACRLVA